LTRARRGHGRLRGSVYRIMASAYNAWHSWHGLSRFYVSEPGVASVWWSPGVAFSTSLRPLPWRKYRSLLFDMAGLSWDSLAHAWKDAYHYSVPYLAAGYLMRGERSSKILSAGLYLHALLRWTGSGKRLRLLSRFSIYLICHCCLRDARFRSGRCALYRAATRYLSSGTCCRKFLPRLLVLHRCDQTLLTYGRTAVAPPLLLYFNAVAEQWH